MQHRRTFPSNRWKADINFTMGEEQLRILVANEYQVPARDVLVRFVSTPDDRGGDPTGSLSVTIRNYNLKPKVTASNDFDFDLPAFFGPYGG